MYLENLGYKLQSLELMAKPKYYMVADVWRVTAVIAMLKRRISLRSKKIW
jgi:hypothetical protein